MINFIILIPTIPNYSYYLLEIMVLISDGSSEYGAPACTELGNSLYLKNLFTSTVDSNLTLYFKIYPFSYTPGQCVLSYHMIEAS